MPESVLEVLIRNKVTGLPEVAAEKEAISQLGSTTLVTAGHTRTHALATNAAAKEERDLSREAAISARAMGELGAKGGETFERFTNLTTAAGGLQGTMLGLGILGLGAVVEGTKSIIELSDKHEEAVKNLEQAYEVAGTKLDDYKGSIDTFIDSNRKFTSDQSVVLDGFAAMTRAGLTQNEVMRAMNDAVDLAALKHLNLGEAERLVLLATQGNSRGLKDLGINVAELKASDENTVKAHKELEKATAEVAKRQDELNQAYKVYHEQPTKAHAEAVEKAQHNLALATQDQKDKQDNANHSMDLASQTLDKLDPKLKGGKQSTSELHQSTNELSNAWQDLATKAGPTLERSLAQDIEWILHVGDAFQIAKDKAADFFNLLAGQHPMGQVVAARSAQYLGSSSVTFPTTAYSGRGNRET